MKILKNIIVFLLFTIPTLAAPPPKLSKQEIQRDWQNIQRFNQIVEDISASLQKYYPTDEQIAQLEAIYTSASALLKKYDRRKNEGTLQFNIYANALILKSKALSLERKAFVLRLKQKLSNSVGSYVLVRLIGDDVIYIKYPLFTEYSVNKLLNTGNWVETVRKLGFRKIIFTDGLNEWTFTP